MKRRHFSRDDWQPSCDQPGTDDGVDPRYDRVPSGRRSDRKLLQLCHDVSRVLGQVLAWELGDDCLAELRVESVVPAPSAARLHVVLSAPAESDVETASERLHARSGRLRSEVAAAIRRRRAPELIFQVVCRRT